jgi:putative glutamine amidotransferase
MQVLNVAFGGDLVQDIPTEVNGALHHAVREPRYAIAHEVWVSPTSRLAALMKDDLEDGESCQVNSRHHQAVRHVGDGLEVTATAPDGVIEAVERPTARFCLGVQWHPENFWRTGEFRPLFEGFVEAARG